MSNREYVYIARLLKPEDMRAASKLVSQSKQNYRRKIKISDVIGGPIKNVQASSVDTSKMIDENGAFFFYADNFYELQEAIDVLRQQPKDAMTFFNRKAGIDNENDTFGGGRQKVLFAAVPSERFYKFAESGKYVATGEGQYTDEDDNAYFFGESVIGMTALKVWQMTGVNFEMKTVNSFLGISGARKEEFIAKHFRDSSDTFGWGNSGKDEM